MVSDRSFMRKQRFTRQQMKTILRMRWLMKSQMPKTILKRSSKIFSRAMMKDMSMSLMSPLRLYATD